jgi:hypothetical protein
MDATATRLVRAPRVVAARSGARAVNRGGTARARRVFALFLGGLIAIFAAFLLSLATAPGGGAALTTLLPLAVVAVPMAALGALLTLGRAPRDAWVHGSTLLVREWTGRVRAYSFEDGLRIRPLERHAAGFLAPAPTELDEIVTATGLRRAYLVQDGFFDFVSGDAGA